MPSDFEVIRSARCEEDLEIIFDHPFIAYQELGDSRDVALDRAAKRFLGIEDDLACLGEAPFQGILEPQIMDGLRHMTKHRAVFYLTVDEASETARVLGVFFGGQEHRRHILERMIQHR